MMRRKILLLPAWYPTKEDPVAGSFFKEQALALARDFDFFVALVSFPPFKVRSFVRNGFRRARITVDASTAPLPEIHCVGFAHLPERAIRFFLRRNVFKEQYLGALGRKLEDYFDDKRLQIFMKAARVLEHEYGFAPSIVYATAAQTNGVEAYVFAKAINVPLVLAEHSPFPFPGTIVTAKTKEALEGAAAILSVSNHLSRMILTQGINCSPDIVGNMIDATFFTQRQKAGTPGTGRAPRILFVGAYSYFKDYDTFFKAISVLRKMTDVNFVVRIVGYDVSKGYSQGEDNFRQHLARYDIGDLVELVPKADRASMVGHYHDSDVLVSTSIQETFGLSCLEAMACGLPVFATRSGGVEDFIVPECGRLVNVKDHVALATLLAQFLHGSIIFDSRKIRENVIGSYGMGPFIERIAAIMNSVMDRHVSMCD